MFGCELPASSLILIFFCDHVTKFRWLWAAALILIFFCDQVTIPKHQREH